MAGLGLFGAGSLAAGLAGSTGQLIAARAGMGVGGALLVTTPLAGVMWCSLLGMVLTAGGLVAIATLAAHGCAGTLLGLLLIGVGTAIASPAMAHAIMSSIPPAQAGVGAAVNGPLAESGNGLGVAVLGAVPNPRFAALIPVAASSLPAALAAAHGEGERPRVLDAFSSGPQTSRLVGASAVLLGGVLAAVLLRRAQRADTRADSDVVAA